MYLLTKAAGVFSWLVRFMAMLRDEERFEALVDRMRERNEEMRRQLAQAEQQEHADRLPPGKGRRK